MMRHLAPTLFALSLCALPGGTRAAHAQSAEAIVPAAIDFVAVPATIDSVGMPAPVGEASIERRDAVTDAPVALSPIMRPVSPMLARDIAEEYSVRSPDFAAMQGRDWKMPTSRSLMIGGTVAVVAGLALIGGDTGAIIAMTGGAVAVYGLYLHYNR